MVLDLGSGSDHGLVRGPGGHQLIEGERELLPRDSFCGMISAMAPFFFGDRVERWAMPTSLH